MATILHLSIISAYLLPHKAALFLFHNSLRLEVYHLYDSYTLPYRVIIRMFVRKAIKCKPPTVCKALVTVAIATTVTTAIIGYAFLDRERFAQGEHRHGHPDGLRHESAADLPCSDILKCNI